MEITYHYPPDFLSLMIDCIPLLNRSKRDLIDFFRGAGVEERIAATLNMMMQQGANKFDMTRYVLTTLNEKSGNDALRQRREIVKRVCEFDSFEHCWEGDRFKAKGLVAEIRELRGKKDSFTRIKEERDQERQSRMAEKNKEIAELARKRERLSEIYQSLCALFTMNNPSERGRELEKVINNAFHLWGILIRESITLKNDDVTGIAEQIDGCIQIDGRIFLVEMKWLKEPVGTKDIGHHLSRLFLREAAGGVVISAAGFTDSAIKNAKDALSQKVVILVHLQEFVRWMEQQLNLSEMLRKKIQAAVIEKEPYWNA